MKSFHLHLGQDKRFFREGIPAVFSLAYRKRSIPWLRDESRTWQFCLRLSGASPTLKAALNGKEYEAAYPHLLIKKPGDVHIFPHLRDFCEALYFTYRPECEPLFRNFGIELKSGLWNIRDVDFLRRLMDRLFITVECGTGIGFYDRIDLQCFDFARELLLACIHPAEESDQETQRLCSIESYLRLHYDEPVDFDVLAQKNGFSPRTFQRRWLKRYGSPPGKFLQKLRLETACHLLTETNCSIEQISQSLHYNTSSYFCCMFRRMTGMTPRRYRETQDRKNSIQN